jgi:hypothetical protein
LLFSIFLATVSIELSLYSHRGIDTAPLYTVYPDLDLHKGKILKPDTDQLRRNGVPHIKNFNSTLGVELKSPCLRMQLSKKDRNSQFPKRFLLQCQKVMSKLRLYLFTRGKNMRLISIRHFWILILSIFFMIFQCCGSRSESGRIGITLPDLDPYPFQANNSTIGVEHGPNIYTDTKP